MTNSKSISVNTEPGEKDYFNFANALMLELDETRSLADATRALLCEHEECDTSTELIGAHFLLRRIMEQLTGVALRLDRSSFSYVPKERAAA